MERCVSAQVTHEAEEEATQHTVPISPPSIHAAEEQVTVGWKEETQRWEAEWRRDERWLFPPLHSTHLPPPSPPLPPSSSIPRPESEVEGRRRKETSVFVEAEEACHGGGGGGNGIGEDQDEGGHFLDRLDRQEVPPL